MTGNMVEYTNMKLDTLNQSRMRCLFDYMADRGMPDSPDGPEANRVRTLGKSQELDTADIEEVIVAATGQLALCGDQLRRLQVSFVTQLSFAGSITSDPANSGGYLYPGGSSAFNPEFLATRAAFELYNLLALRTSVSEGV